MNRQLHKFGGSSLANAECYLRVAALLKQHSNDNDLIVVSAAGKTTNRLITFFEGLESRDQIALEALHELREFQLGLIEALLEGEAKQKLYDLACSEFSHLAELTVPLTEAKKSAVLGHGEMWSARLLAALLTQQGLDSTAQDSRLFLRVEAGIQPEIDYDRSYALMQGTFAQQSHKRIVITGFMAGNDHGETILLGRNGSDYSATAIGALAEVATVTIWSDVAGVYSADPRIVQEADLLPLLRLDEANELARLASPILHSRTLQPVAQSAMELKLKCSYAPSSGSTTIERELVSSHGAKIVTSVDDVNVLHLSFAQRDDFKQQYRDLLEQLQQAQKEPLAYDVQYDKYAVRLAYPVETVGDALGYLYSLDVDLKIEQEEGYSLVAAVGADVTKNMNHCFGFYQQLKASPIEFISESSSGLSLIAILRCTNLSQLVKGMHSQLFSA